MQDKKKVKNSDFYGVATAFHNSTIISIKNFKNK